MRGTDRNPGLAVMAERNKKRLVSELEEELRMREAALERVTGFGRATGIERVTTKVARAKRYLEVAIAETDVRFWAAASYADRYEVMERLDETRSER